MCDVDLLIRDEEFIKESGAVTEDLLAEVKNEDAIVENINNVSEKANVQELEFEKNEEKDEEKDEEKTERCEEKPEQIETSAKSEDQIPNSENDKDVPMEVDSSANYAYYWKNKPKLICSAKSEYVPTEKYENFTKGCLWSPDGTCLLVPSEDFRIRIFDLPREFYSSKNPADLSVGDFKASLAIKDGGTIYDCCWYPYMDSWKPETCCLISCSQESPVHLWDAFTGELRATYRAYNQLDEVEAALSVQFINQSTEIWCGFKNTLRIFDMDRPGRQVSDIPLNKTFPNVTGLVSCIRENPLMTGLVAFGTYSKCVGLYKDGPICSFKTGNGVTQIEFSPCGMKMYSAVRRKNEFICWDLRNPGTVLWSSENRMSDTNQRIQFSISFDGSHIVSGGTEGFVQIWQSDVAESNSDENILDEKWKISTDCVNGVNLHKSMPILATSTGQRLPEDDDLQRDNGVQLWWCGNQ